MFSEVPGCRGRSYRLRSAILRGCFLYEGARIGISPTSKVAKGGALDLGLDIWKQRHTDQLCLEGREGK